MKRKKFTLYTLTALEKMGVASHSHLKKIMLEVSKGERDEYKGFRFVSPGSELKNRNFWLAYEDEGIEVEIVNEP